MKYINNYDNYLNEEINLDNNDVLYEYYGEAHNPDLLDDINEGKSLWWESAKGLLFGPLYIAHKEYKKNPSGASAKTKSLVKGILLGPLLGTKTGQSAIKNVINTTPAGIIKNMSIAADKGDATDFKSAWQAAKKYADKDLQTLEKAAFQDLKSFGSVMKKMGF